MSRRVPEHATASMGIGEVKIFQRRAIEHCNLNSLYFTVMKTEERMFGKEAFIFYAIAGDEIDGVVGGFNQTHKYNHQIAFIVCNHGWIDLLEVFDRSLEVVGPFENPRRCGVGIVLTELCLIDPNVNDPREGNLGFDYIEGQQTMRERAKDNCLKFVGLKMAAKASGPNPRAGGLTYLTAAIRMDYDFLLINSGYCHDEKMTRTNIYDLQDAKDNYDPVTGNINACKGYGSCEAYNNNWFFCKRN